MGLVTISKDWTDWCILNWHYKECIHNIYSLGDLSLCTPPTRVRTNSPSGSRTRDSGAGGGRSNKERQRLQPLASVARAPLLRSGEWGLHTALTGIHPLHLHTWKNTHTEKKEFYLVLFYFRNCILIKTESSIRMWMSKWCLFVFLHFSSPFFGLSFIKSLRSMV